MPTYDTRASLSSTFATLADEAHNILDPAFGVELGEAASQTAAIKATLDAYPGEAFRFPSGNYRLDTTLVVGQGNPMFFDDGARVYAGAAMTHLIDWTWAGADYAEDKAIIGGLFDGNLNADTVLRINGCLRFTLSRVTIRDGINRGIFTGPTGAEILGYDIRLHNTTIGNVTDNVAIETTMGDGHYRDVFIRDWTVGVKDTAANRWDRIHPWIGPDAGAVTQMTSRFPTSIAFDITGASDLDGVHADTCRTAFKIRTSGGYTAAPRLINAHAAWADDPTLPTALAAANPAYVLDNTDAVGVIVDRLTVKGHSGTPAAFLTGGATGIYARNSYSYGSATGVQDYLAGVEQGYSTWSPTLLGTGAAGSPSYNNQQGHMVVNGSSVFYTVAVNAALDGTITGNLRIGGFPVPAGATGVSLASGAVGYVSGANVEGVLAGGGTSEFQAIPVSRGAGGSAEIDATSLQSTTVEIWLTMQAYLY